MLQSDNSPRGLCESDVSAAFVHWRGSDTDVVVARAPGRINLIGEHTDYNQGWVMPMILDRGVYAACRPAGGTRHQIRSEDFDEVASFKVGTMPASPPGHWSFYVAGMLKHLSPASAMEMLIAGNVPVGAGLSSSAALTMATGLAAEAVSGAAITALEMARIGQWVEHEYLGVQCGLMDQMVSRMGRSRHAFLLDCRSLEWSHIPVPTEETCFIVVNSQVQRALAGSKYNERRRECEDALAWLQASGAAVDSVREVALPMLDSSAPDMPVVLAARLRHVVEENGRAVAAAEALRHGRWNQLGNLLTASHRSLQGRYEVSCAELDALVDSALTIDGVFGARMMGGGFGGCTLNLVHRSAAGQFGPAIKRAYYEECGRNCSVLRVGLGVEAAILPQK